MTAGRRPRPPRLTGPAIVVALGLAGLVLGSAVAFALGGRTNVSSPPGSVAAAASAEASVASIGTSPAGPGSRAPGSASESSSSGQPVASTGPSGSVAAPPSSAAPAPPSGTRARVDAGLLSILPQTVGGLAIREFPEAEHQAVSDPNLGQSVARFATAFVGDVNGANWAYVAVVDLRPGAGTDAFYRDWRDTFDSSACERAGGVAGHNTLVIAGRSVERANCGSGVRTYHLLIGGKGVLVSVSDFGDVQLGQQVLAALKP